MTFEQLYEPGAEEELTESINVLLYDLAYNIRCQTKSEDESKDMFGPNDKQDFCDIAKTLIKPARLGCFCASVFHMVVKISVFHRKKGGCKR